MADVNRLNALGTTEESFQIGLSGGLIKNNGGILETRTSDDTAYQIMRSADPVDTNDVANKNFVESTISKVFIDDQVDTSSSLPNNTAVQRFLLVTTSGSGASIGDILEDDGSSTGTMEIISARNGREIFVSSALTGGSISLDGSSIYSWRTSSSSWQKISDIGSLSGGLQEIHIPITSASATFDSITIIPANYNIRQVDLKVTTAFSSGTTIQVGNTSVPNLIMNISDGKPEQVGIYSELQNTEWGVSDSIVRVSIGGSPIAGAGIVMVRYVNPLG